MAGAVGNLAHFGSGRRPSAIVPPGCFAAMRRWVNWSSLCVGSYFADPFSLPRFVAANALAITALSAAGHAAEWDVRARHRCTQMRCVRVTVPLSLLGFAAAE